MPLPKDPQKLKEYKEKMSKIAKERGYGKWMQGKKATDETKQKMSESQKKRITPEEKERRKKQAISNKYGKWMQGKKLSADTIKKISEYRKGKTYLEIYGKDRAFQEIEKRRQGNINVKRTYQSEQSKHNLKTSLSRKGKTYLEIYGDEKSVEEAKKRSIGHLKKWEGHIRSGCRDKKNGDHLYNTWRKLVFARDDYTCQECNTRGGRLHAHHIQHWATHLELRYEISNGITLCPHCHSKKHPNNKALIKA